MKAIPMTARRDGKRLSCVSPPWHLVSISYYQQVGLRLRWHLHGLVPHPIITIQQTQKPSVPVIVVLRSMSTSRWLLGLSVQSVEHENEQWIIRFRSTSRFSELPLTRGRLHLSQGSWRNPRDAAFCLYVTRIAPGISGWFPGRRSELLCH